MTAYQINKPKPVCHANQMKLIKAAFVCCVQKVLMTCEGLPTVHDTQPQDEAISVRDCDQNNQANERGDDGFECMRCVPGGGRDLWPRAVATAWYDDSNQQLFPSRD